MIERARPASGLIARLVALVAIIGLIVAACGGAASPSPSTSATATPAASPSDASSEEPGESPSEGPKVAPSPFPSKSGDLPTVKMAQSVPQMAFAPLQIALHMNFFEYLGVKIDFIELQSGATARQALVGGSVDLVDSASTEVAAAVAQGVEFVSIQATINQTLQMCVSEDWASQKGVTPDSSLEDRAAALEGATIGITGPGAVSDRATRWLMIEYGGLDPNTQATITQVGGGAGAMAGALEANQIQAFLLSPPSCQVAGGVVLIPPSDVPEFANYVHEVLFGMRDWIEGNRETATLVATAISMGNNYILEYPEASLKILQEGPFSSVDPAIVEDAFYGVILPQVEPVRNGLQSEEGWSDTMTVLVESGVIDAPIPFDEGTFWTNEYVDVDQAEEIFN
jgi:ABC-type nitrate/sulfonate/bicarbonate transport system substrate-binding protein